MTLPMPGFDNIQLIIDVVSERAEGVNAGFFQSIQQEWCNRVQGYIDFAGCPPNVNKWPDITPRKKSFLNLYLSPAEHSVQANVLRALRDHELLLCPACGELGAPYTLDHYLPKDDYPHFCISPINLFPMCDACQRAKGTKVGNATNSRFFIHPYFDTFTAQQVIFLDIQGPYHAPAYTMNIVQNIGPLYVELTRTHIRELEIEQRYIRFFRGQHRRLLKMAGALRDSGQNFEQSLLSYQSGAASSSLNSWEHIFYQGVTSNPDFIDYLTNQPLPGFL